MRLFLWGGPGRNSDNKCNETPQASPGRSYPLPLHIQHPIRRPVHPPKPSAKGLQLSPRSGVGERAHSVRIGLGANLDLSPDGSLASEGNCGQSVRSGTTPFRSRRNLYPLSPPAASLLLTPAPSKEAPSCGAARELGGNTQGSSYLNCGLGCGQTAGGRTDSVPRRRAAAAAVPLSPSSARAARR